MVQLSGKGELFGWKILFLFFIYLFIDFFLFLEISSRHLTLKDYFDVLGEDCRKKLWTELESCKGNQISGWKLLADYMSSKKGKNIFSQEEISRIDRCCFHLSKHIIEHMITRGVTIDHLEKAILSKCSMRKDLLSCIEKLKGIKKEGNPLLKEYGLLELFDLKVCLTNKYHKTDWKEIFREVCSLTGDKDNESINYTLKVFENIKEKQQDVEDSPCEVLFCMLKMRRPDLSLLYIYNALKIAKQESSTKLFINNIATLLHQKRPKDSDA